LHVQTAVQNETGQTVSLSVLTELLDPQGQVVAKKITKTSLAAGANNEVKTTLNVKNPQLWSLETPHQHTLRTRVLQGTEQIDASGVKAGFRTLTFDPNKGFALNGEWMKMKGVCIHHDAGVLGAEVYPEVWRRRLLALKDR